MTRQQSPVGHGTQKRAAACSGACGGPAPHRRTRGHPRLGGRPCGCTRPWNSSRRPGRAPPRGRGAGGCSGWEAGGVRFGPTAPPPLLGDPRLALSTAGCRTGGAGARLASSGGGGSPRGPRGPPLAADGPRIRVWARGGALPPAGVLFPSRAPAGANWWPSAAQAWHNWGSWSPRGGVEGDWLAPMQRAPGGWTQAAQFPPRLLSACWPAFCSMEHFGPFSCPLRLARGNGDSSSGGAGATPHPVPRRPQPNQPGQLDRGAPSVRFIRCRDLEHVDGFCSRKHAGLHVHPAAHSMWNAPLPSGAAKCRASPGLSTAWRGNPWHHPGTKLAYVSTHYGIP